MCPQRVLALEDLQGQPRRGVPGDVAVQEPGAGVVGFEGDDDEAAGGEENHVSTGGVFEVGFELVGTVKLARLLQQSEIMPV